MKLRVAVWGIFLALCVAPAFADSVGFSNHGLVAGSGSNGGITTTSDLTKVTFNGTTLFSGPCGSVSFDTGSFTGSLLGGGQFSAGTFDIAVSGIGDVLFASNFSGTWTKVSNDLYELIGTFSTTANGLHLTGTTKQFVELEFEDGRLTFDDVHGKTCVTAAPVPEPGTLTLLGTGLLGLGGAVRRKFASLKQAS
jgi:PEP-CTERM motif